MRLNEELYFEITAEGKRESVERFASFILSGELDDFFDVSDDYIVYDDNFDSASPDEKVSFVFTNDEYGVSIDSLNPEDFLDVFCKGSMGIFLSGTLYDIDDEEYSFISHEDDVSFTNTKNISEFNDELDAKAYEEELEAKEDYEE